MRDQIITLSEQNDLIHRAVQAGFTGISTDFHGNWWGWNKDGVSTWIVRMVEPNKYEKKETVACPATAVDQTNIKNRADIL